MAAKKKSKTADEVKTVLTIEEAELADIDFTRKTVADLKARVKAEEARLAQMEGQAITKLNQGAVVAAGRFKAIVSLKTGNCVPSWKTEMVQHMECCHGQAPAVTEQQAKDKYPPTSKQVLVISQEMEV